MSRRGMRIKPKMPRFTVKLKHFMKKHKQKVKGINEEYD
jgi:hypothetical protein